MHDAIEPFRALGSRDVNVPRQRGDHAAEAVGVEQEATDDDPRGLGRSGKPRCAGAAGQQHEITGFDDAMVVTGHVEVALGDDEDTGCIRVQIQPISLRQGAGRDLVAGQPDLRQHVRQKIVGGGASRARIRRIDQVFPRFRHGS